MADERLDWFPCNPAKLLGALGGMKANEGYVYVVVLLRIYEVGGPCLDTLDALAVRTRLNRRIVSDTLDSLFRAGRLVRKDGGIHNPVAEVTLASSRALRAERQRAGSEGGKKSVQKRKENQSPEASKASDLLEQNPTPLQLQEQDSLFPSGNKRAAKPLKPAKVLTPLEIARKELFDRGKEVLGEGTGGVIQNLLAAKHGNVALARAAIEQASTMDNPRQYVGAILRGGSNGKTTNAVGGFSGLNARLRQAVAEDGPDVVDDATGFEPAHGR